MAFRRAFAAATALVAGILMVVPANAHSTYFSDDDKYRIVTGQLDEPVYTYAKTGLDVCFTLNTTAREPLPTVNPGALTAVLVSPSNEELTMPLKAQFGRPGCYQFSEAYILTEPGQYTINLDGLVDATAVDMHGMLAGGKVGAMENVTFPDSGVRNNAQLAHENAALKAQVDALTARVSVLEGKAGEAKGAGAPASVLLLMATLGMAFVMRRKA